MLLDYTILIIGKDLTRAGGINNYYNLFLNYFEHKSINIKYFTIGLKDPIKRNKVVEYLKRYIKDTISFSKILMEDKKIKIVQFNPSLIPIPLVRDTGLLIIAKLFKKKVIIFFHGWKISFVNFLEKYYLCRYLFIKIYSIADKIIVLGEDFKNTLVTWGIEKKNIHVSKMMFDGSLFCRRNSYRNENKIKFLYLGRLQDIKGIFDIVKAFSLLKTKEYDFHFSFVGSPVNENTLNNLKSRIKDAGLSKYSSLKGFVSGKDKIKQFSNADVFVFPSYTEGCPNAVLEAMAAGLFIISTNVGALKEIVIDGKNGFLVRVGDAVDLSKKIEKAIKSKEFVNKIGRQNRIEAFNKFEVHIIIQQIREIYDGLLFQ